jgi:arsenate reductase
MKTRVLFICRHNSGRSQIAEAFLKKMGKNDFYAESAGLEPADSVNPLVIEVMKEEGIDLSRQKPQSVFKKFKEGELYDHVITVCADTEEKCPIFPGIVKRWHMPFPDPSGVKGTQEEKIAAVRGIRDQIKQWLMTSMDSLRK